MFAEKEEYREKGRFLYGESMGGAVALLIHRKEPTFWTGAVLVAPMCKVTITSSKVATSWLFVHFGGPHYPTMNGYDPIMDWRPIPIFSTVPYICFPPNLLEAHSSIHVTCASILWLSMSLIRWSRCKQRMSQKLPHRSQIVQSCTFLSHSIAEKN